MNKKYDDLLNLLRPPKAAYSRYFKDSSAFIEEYSKRLPLISSGGLKIKELKFERSSLYNKPYLVALINSDYFSSSLVDYDAAAIKSLSVFMGIESPPLVLIAGVESFSKKEHYRSILEHEFTHINQAILNEFPRTIDCKKGMKIGVLYEIFLENIKVEYQANFIQLSSYPALFPDELNMPLDQWCILRGYTQSLEKLISSYVYSVMDLNELESFFIKFQGSIAKDFKKMNLIEEVGESYAKHLNEYLLIALNILLESNFNLGSLERFVELQDWCNSNNKKL
jgi:hypothetical protein